MAKKRLTAKQRKQHKRASYIRTEYYKTFDAISYMMEYGGSDAGKIKLNIPSKITKRSLDSIRKKYKELRTKLDKKNYVLPTKKEMVKWVRNEPTQEYRRSRAQAGTRTAPPSFDPNTDYLDDLRGALEELKPLKPQGNSDKFYTEKLLPKFEEAKLRILGTIDYARVKLGDTETAEILAANQFIGRIENLQEKYTHEMMESIDDDLIPLIESAVGEALDGI